MTSWPLLENSVLGVLAAPINAAVTAAGVTLETGSNPYPEGVGEAYPLYLTFQDADNPLVHEIVKVTGASGANITAMERGARGTTARAWTAGTLVSLNLHVQDIGQMRDALDGLAAAGYVTASGAVSAIKADAAWKATDWNAAYGWGDHGLEGYLKSGDITGLVPYTGATGAVTLGAHTLSTTAGLISPKLYPAADSTTALQILKADGTTPVVTVDTTNGRVGIGTAAPDYEMDVVGNKAAMSLSLRARNTDATGSVFFRGTSVGAEIAFGSYGNSWVTTQYRGNSILSTNGEKLRIAVSSSSGVITFHTGGIANAEERIRIDSGGKVGIGTTTPDTLLSVANNNYISSKNFAGTGPVNMWKVNTDNVIEGGANVSLGNKSLTAASMTTSALFVRGAMSLQRQHEGSTYNLAFGVSDDQVTQIAYIWPPAQGAAGTALTNDGSGVLSWSSTLSLASNDVASLDIKRADNDKSVMTVDTANDVVYFPQRKIGTVEGDYNEIVGDAFTSRTGYTYCRVLGNDIAPVSEGGNLFYTSVVGNNIATATPNEFSHVNIVGHRIGEKAGNRFRFNTITGSDIGNEITANMTRNNITGSLIGTSAAGYMTYNTITGIELLENALGNIEHNTITAKYLARGALGNVAYNMITGYTLLDSTEMDIQFNVVNGTEIFNSAVNEVEYNVVTGQQIGNAGTGRARYNLIIGSTLANVATGNIVRNMLVGTEIVTAATGYVAYCLADGLQIANTATGNIEYLFSVGEKNLYNTTNAVNLSRIIALPYESLALSSASDLTDAIAIGYRAGYENAFDSPALFGREASATAHKQMVLGSAFYTGGVKVGAALNAPSYSLADLNTAPASAGATGTKGEIRITADALYVCVATDTWVRTTLSTWS